MSDHFVKWHLPSGRTAVIKIGKDGKRRLSRRYNSQSSNNKSAFVDPVTAFWEASVNAGLAYSTMCTKAYGAFWGLYR